MNRFIYGCLVVLFIFLWISAIVLAVVSVAYGEDTIVEKNGTISIIGNPTTEEKTEYLAYYKQRMEKREQIVVAEIERAHEIEIEKIRAQAMLDYLLAESIATESPNNNIYVKGSKTKVTATINNDNTNETVNNNTTNNDNANSNTNDNTNDNRNTITIRP